MVQYTTNDLAIRTLQDLNIIASDEIPSSEDMNYTLATIRSEFMALQAEGMAFNNHSTDVNSINETLFTELSRHMGFALGAAFGVMTAAVAEAGKDASASRLWILLNHTKNPEVMTIERAARGARIRDPIISQ